jgi:hypothetical protein
MACSGRCDAESGKNLPLRRRSIDETDGKPCFITEDIGGLMRFLNPSDKTAAMDYNSALASAVAWLGNRYLLAMPAKRLTHFERCNAGLATVPSIPPRSRSQTTSLGTLATKKQQILCTS